jgi:hypothetical protein
LSASSITSEELGDRRFYGAIFSEPDSLFRPGPEVDIQQRSRIIGGNCTIIYGLNEDGERFFVAGPHIGCGTVESLLPDPEPRDENTTFHVIDGGKRVIAIETIEGRRRIKEQVWPAVGDGPIHISHEDLVELICNRRPRLAPR